MQRISVFVVALLAALAGWFAPVTPPDLRWLDLQFAAIRAFGEPQPDLSVVVVGIDSRSMDAVAEPLTLWHRPLAEFLMALRDARPRLVALDIVLPDRSYEAVAPGLDQALLRALLLTRASFPTVLAITVDENRNPRMIFPSFVTASGTAPGFALWPVDGDGVVRRFDEHLGENDEHIDTLAGRVGRAVGRTPTAGYVDFALGAPFRYVPFVDVLEAGRRNDHEWLAKTFAGKVVFLGTTMKFVDTVRLPVTLAGWGPRAEETPGVLLQAQGARAFLANRIIQPVPPWATALIAALAALLSLLARNPRLGAIIAMATIAVLFAASHAALRAGHFLPIAWAAASSLAGLALYRGVEVVRSLAERRRLRSSFAGYVSPAVMSEILKGRIQPDEGTQRYVCVLFSDIRGYTTRSEGMTPAQAITFLNRYFEGVVDTVHRHNGTVISFMGDGIMAVFGAPQDLENPCESGFQAARAMFEGLEGFNAQLRAEGQAPVAIGVGLHAGPALVGHVGSKSRHDYTAIGDVTNVASRLEGATKETGYRVVVSKEIAAQLEDASMLVPLGPVAIKGHTPVEAFGYLKVPAP